MANRRVASQKSGERKSKTRVLNLFNICINKIIKALNLLTIQTSYVYIVGNLNKVCKQQTR